MSLQQAGWLSYDTAFDITILLHLLCINMYMCGIVLEN